MQKKIRFGVLGASRIAKKAAIPAIVDSEYAELAMVGTRSPEKASDLSVPTGTYEDVLSSKDVDAVYISLPNSLHEEWTVKAAEAGKHVWCEKPAALSYESAERMIAAAQKNNVRLMEGFMFLHHPQHAKVLEIIKSGVLGEITSFEGRFAYPMPDAGNIRLEAELGGGIYNDALVYPIRASRFVFGEEPGSILCNLTMDPTLGVDVKAEATLTYSGGRTASISSAFDPDYRSTYRVIGTKGSLIMERAYAVPKDMPVKIFIERGNTQEEILIEPADHFRLMIDDFCKEVASEARTKDYENDLLSQAKILDAGRKSDNQQRIVEIVK
ncbi:hypothetical protein A3A38_00160 [Candidatus Kaiserbacteria bacterium RIFCSPLOWO2_01_FULL_53_17]|uniref:Gfo/Idh/MocA-like oxidoreductase N-terminal domain-containing protein n=1 Tax=Candidatus Kaiserbacteria bacterium RIFCSPLOWO2_01_FULL_53_17 TaxID=1798511 RepID=A0A1F6EG73_9BACT|nr:MAG: hypothetical protein A3A38_00160 [Candidatus Kaiserbacteria bacterium RIFCSPLOWO2_01_FULL_53_17]